MPIIFVREKYWPIFRNPKQIIGSSKEKLQAQAALRVLAVSLLHAHLVFVTKYRRKAISKRAFEILRKSMRKTSLILGIDLVALESDGDHLHVMVCYPPTLSLSTIVKRLKGASSRLLRQHCLPEVTQKLWGNHFWSPSYFVVSCGGTPLEKVKDYVE